MFIDQNPLSDPVAEKVARGMIKYLYWEFLKRDAVVEILTDEISFEEGYDIEFDWVCRHRLKVHCKNRPNFLYVYCNAGAFVSAIGNLTLSDPECVPKMADLFFKQEKRIEREGFGWNLEE